MRIITELELRDAWRISEFSSYTVPQGARLTPAAMQYLNDRKIEVLERAEEPTHAAVPPSKQTDKPEGCTHLNGKELVAKHHPRIRLRGMADAFYAFMVDAEVFIEPFGMPVLMEEIRILRKYAGQIMMAEVTERELPFIDFYGWDPQEIRNRSHYPKKYYGIDHFRTHPLNGPVMARLNMMRTKVRELEVQASEIFGSQEGAAHRPDLILALNRFSSLVYILMCQLKAGVYNG